jgi:hypothetical protein
MAGTFVKMARAYVAKKTSRFQLSKAGSQSRDHVLKGLRFSIEGIIWETSHENPAAFSSYGWVVLTNGSYMAESHKENRRLYIKHLKEQVCFTN